MITLQAQITAAHRALLLQTGLDPELVVSDPDTDGRVQIEGTVNLLALAQAILTADTAHAIDGPLPSDDAQWTAKRAGAAWDSAATEAEGDEAAARIVQAYGDKRAAGYTQFSGAADISGITIAAADVRPAGEIVRLIVTGSVSGDLDASSAPAIPAHFHETAAHQVEKALGAFWGLIDWKAAPVEPQA